jgi:KaiC/GvpD/RAD55 family RecA-like ATPase
MLSFDIDTAYECFKKLFSGFQESSLSESDSRAKILDPIFKDCLGWTEDDITREEHVNKGFIDYTFKVDNRPVFVLEAKKVGYSFIIPEALKKRRYKISGAISTDNKISDAINQAHKYSVEIGTTYAIVSNGHQFIIFESFKRCGKWRDGFCLVFSSLQDIITNFSLFFSILSKQAVIGGSLKRYVAEEVISLEFKRPLDLVHNESAICGKNVLAARLTPIIAHIFKDITDDSQIDVLRKCYVRQKQICDTDSIIRSSFDKLPYYAKHYDINWFKETEAGAGEFQLSFEKCNEFLKKEAQLGSVIMLLGGIGAGKTTFVHHFFKIVMADREDIVWFYVDFGVSPPDLDKIEGFIFDSIIRNYQERYKKKLEDYLISVGLGTINPNSESLLAFFTMLRYKSYTVAIVLDNVDQHSYTSPKYQERVFEYAQHFANKFKIITLLTLREESFFRSTRSGVLDAYHIPKFHIESPNFEELIRNRINYTLESLDKDEQERIRQTISPLGEWKIVRMFFMIINYSIRKNRRVGREILRFVNDVSGGNMRQALRFINAFMTSGNTDIGEMINIETDLPPDTPEYAHYQIPLHHIIKSIVLEDYKYYSSSHSNIMNIFQVNPQQTYSHFVHLRILAYLNKRTNYFVALDKGFVDINQIIEDAESAGMNRKTIENSLSGLSHFGLVEFDNQNKEGYATAQYVRMTATGIYYLEELAHSFPYLDLVFMDTPICEGKTLQELRKGLSADLILDKKDRIEARFKRTEIFLKYLKQMEDDEFKSNPELSFSDLTKIRFMDSIIKKWEEQVQYIREKLYG